MTAFSDRHALRPLAPLLRSASATAFATVFATLAAPAQAEEETNLSSVVVSASKVEQSTLEAPSNVSVVTARKIEASNAVRLGDVLTAQVPSLYLRGGAVGNTTRDAGSSIISLRGAYGARTKVVVDGVASLADANSGNLNFSTVALGDIERVEVVPGVSSSLYGSDAIGGVINVITKAPVKREFTAGYTRGFDDGRRDKAEFSYRDKFQNGVGVSLSYYWQHMDGYANNDLITVKPTACGACAVPVGGWRKTLDNTGAVQYIIGDKGAAPSTSQSFTGTLFYDISPSDKIKAGLTHYESKLGYSPYNLYLERADGRPLALPLANLRIDGQRLASLAETSTWLGSSPSQRREDRFFIGYEGKFFNDYLLKIDFSRFDRDYFYVQPNTAGATYSGGPGTATHTPNVTQDVQAQLSFPMGKRHFLVAGLAVNKARLNRKVYALGNWRDDASKVSLNDQGDGYTQTNSVFLQDQIAVTPDLDIYLGGRYDAWSNHGFIAKWVGGVQPPKTVDKSTQAALSPRAAAVYKLTPAISLKSSVGKAFRAPTLYDLYAADTVSGSKLITSDAGLKPEKATAWDLGAEINFANGAQLKAAYFNTRISDMIYAKETVYGGPYTATVPKTVTILSQKTNAAQGLTKGIEISGEAPLASWLRASASYTYTSAKITRDDTGADLLGKTLVFVPKNMASFGLEAKYQAWSAHWSSRYSGLQYSNATNSDSQKDVFGGVSKYWISDFKVSYQLDSHFRVSALVNNVFDKKYYEYYRMPGRNAAIQLSGSF